MVPSQEPHQHATKNCSFYTTLVTDRKLIGTSDVNGKAPAYHISPDRGSSEEENAREEDLKNKCRKPQTEKQCLGTFVLFITTH